MVAQFVAIGIGSLIGGAVSLAAFGPGFGDILTQNLYNFFQSKLPAISELIRAYKKGKITKQQFDDLMTYQGFDSEMANIVLESNLESLGLLELLTLYHRYKNDEGNPYGINKDWLDQGMDAIGIPEERRAQTIEANRPVPQLDDIIRFAVRDVFEPEQANLAGLFEDLPQRFLDEATKRGLDEEDAKLYWASHWFLPSTHQMIEMSQRLFDHPNPEVRFGEREMLAGFKLADIAPKFRERLLAISKTPIGRVDIRRFDRMGLYGEGEQRRQNLIRAYMELGYKRSDAEKQAEFTTQLNDNAEESGSAAEVLRFYREGVFTENKREVAKQLLIDIGTPEERAERLLKLEDLKQIDAKERKEIESVKERFLNGTIKDKNGLRDALGKIELTTTDRNKFYEDIIKEKEKNEKRMSLSDADRLRRLGIISSEEWQEIYKEAGIFEEDIKFLDREFSFTKSADSKAPDKDDLIAFAQSGFMLADEFIEEMKSLGYTDRAIELYMLTNDIPFNRELLELENE